jgi:cbb3-type cytochrome oxidase subunit 3
MKKRFATLLGYSALTLLVWTMQAGVAMAQCPMCKAAVETGNGGESKTVSGLNTGIIYLFALPYGSLILLGIVLYLAYRRRKRENARAQMVTLDKVEGLGGLDTQAQS